MLLWIAIGGEPELVTIQPVPVLYRNLPTGLLLSDSPGEIRVELRGHSGTLGRSALADVYTSIDLSGVSGPGEQTFTLSDADFSLPAGVTFMRAEPSQVRLTFDRVLSKLVPVTPRIKGMPPPGYTVIGEIVTPDHLSISGPAQRVSAIDTAETDLVDVSALTQTTDVRVNAFVPDPRVQFESPPVVTVHLTIQKTETKP